LAHFSLQTIILVTVPDECLAGPWIPIAKQNCRIASTFLTQSAPSSEFLTLHEPFPNVVDAALLDAPMS